MVNLRATRLALAAGLCFASSSVQAQETAPACPPAPAVAPSTTYQDYSTNQAAYVVDYASNIGLYADSYRSMAGAELDAIMDKAYRALLDGRYDDVRRLLVPVTGWEPYRPKIESLRGAAWMGLGNAKKSATHFQYAVNLSRRDVGANQGLALARIAQGKTEHAEKIVARLQKRAIKCGGRCGDAKALDDAIGNIKAAIESSQNPA